MLFAAVFSLMSRSGLNGAGARFVLWTGWLWIIVFGMAFLNEILRSSGAPHINVFQSGVWQPLMPMVLGVILLVLWPRRNRTTN